MSQTGQHTGCLCRRRGGRSIRGFRAAAAPVVYYSSVSAVAADVLATSASMPRFRQRLRRMARPTTVHWTSWSPVCRACNNWPLLCEQAWSIELMHQGPAWSGGLLLRLPACSLAHGTDGLGRGGRWGSELPGLSGHPAGFYAGELVFLLTGCYGECGENGARRIWGASVWCGSCQASGLV